MAYPTFMSPRRAEAGNPGQRVDVIPEDPFKIPERFHAYDGYAQDLSLLYGKILRIDVDHGAPGYAIPPTNPFRGSDLGRAEIYAWGFRNPFRIWPSLVGNPGRAMASISHYNVKWLISRDDK